MNLEPTDTNPETKRLRIERLRRVPLWRKLELMADMCRSVRVLALAGLHQRHPQDIPDQLRCRLAGLLPGSELAARAHYPLQEES